MIKATYEDITEAQKSIVEAWGEAGEKVVEACLYTRPFNGEFKEFMSHCTCCGGNWGGMLLTGIKALFPEVWNAIPDDMGIYAWNALCNTLLLCGVYVIDPEKNEKTS